MYAKNAELKAGAVVLAAIGSLLALYYFASGADLFTKKREVHIRFQQGFASPLGGDVVYMNGVPIGTVDYVVQREERRAGARLTERDRADLMRREPPDPDGEIREIYVLAVAELDARQRLPRGTSAEIAEAITGTRRLSLMPGNHPEDLSDDDTHRNPIPGRQAGDVGEIMRSVQDLVRKVTALVENGQTIFGDVRALLQSLHRKVEAIEAQEISANVRDATASLKATLSALEGRFDEIAANVAATSVDVRAAAAEGRGAVQQAAKEVPELLATLNRVAARLDELVAKTAPEIEAMVSDLREAARGFKALGGEFEGIGAQVSAILGDAGGDVRRTFARLAEVGRNLQDASEDIKAHPWKLLNKPDAQEIAYENLRTTAQSMVRAAQQANETTQRIQELLDRKDLPEDERKKALEALYETARRNVVEYDRYSEMLRDLLRRGGGPPAPPIRSGAPGR
jgi:ABC-type transporter Mla subunit MlaD